MPRLLLVLGIAAAMLLAAGLTLARAAAETTLTLTATVGPTDGFPVGRYVYLPFEVPAGTRQLHVSGQLGIAPGGAMQPDITGQLEAAMDNVEALLASAGLGRSDSDMAKTTFFLTRKEDLPALGEVWRRRWASEQPPAVTVIVVAALARPDALIEVEATAAAAQ